MRVKRVPWNSLTNKVTYFFKFIYLASKDKTVQTFTSILWSPWDNQTFSILCRTLACVFSTPTFAHCVGWRWSVQDGTLGWCHAPQQSSFSLLPVDQNVAPELPGPGIVSLDSFGLTIHSWNIELWLWLSFFISVVIMLEWCVVWSKNCCVDCVLKGFSRHIHMFHVKRLVPQVVDLAFVLLFLP